jgi:hypothetical protein
VAVDVEDDEGIGWGWQVSNGDTVPHRLECGKAESMKMQLERERESM